MPWPEVGCGPSTTPGAPPRLCTPCPLFYEALTLLVSRSCPSAYLAPCCPARLYSSSHALPCVPGHLWSISQQHTAACLLCTATRLDAAAGDLPCPPRLPLSHLHQPPPVCGLPAAPCPGMGVAAVLCCLSHTVHHPVGLQVHKNALRGSALLVQRRYPAVVGMCRCRATPRQPATTPSSGTSPSMLWLLGHVYTFNECCRAQCTPLTLWGDGGGENRAPQPVPRAWGGHGSVHYHLGSWRLCTNFGGLELHQRPTRP